MGCVENIASALDPAVRWGDYCFATFSHSLIFRLDSEAAARATQRVLKSSRAPLRDGLLFNMVVVFLLLPFRFPTRLFMFCRCLRSYPLVLSSFYHVPVLLYSRSCVLVLLCYHSFMLSFLYYPVRFSPQDPSLLYVFILRSSHYDH